MHIAILLMAAGESKRMGDRIKQLLPWENTNLISHAITTAANSKVTSVKIVLGAYAGEIKKTLSPEVEYYTCENWQRGLGTSIAYGIQRVLDSKDKPDKILIMLADQPFIDTAFLNNLIDRSVNSGYLIIATQYKYKAGVPAIFDKKLFSEISKLKGNKGAREIIKKYTDETELIYNPNAAKDIDTIEDFEAYAKQ